MTLDQILLGDVCRTLSGKIAPVEIDDQPRFGYRSLMLDPARHFLPSEDVKFYIDQMVRYKYMYCNYTRQMTKAGVSK